MRLHRNTKLTLLISGMVLAGLVTVHARIFNRWGGSGDAFGMAWGWERAYETTMQINGGRGTVTVFGADSPQAGVLRELGAHYESLGVTHFFYPGQAMGWGIALHDGKVERFLVTSRDPGETSVIYRISQTEAQYRKGRPDYTRHRLVEIPVFPGSRPGYFNGDAATRTDLEVSRTGAQPQVVFLHLDSALREAGWIASLPASGAMRVYQKGRDIAFVQVSKSPAGESVITRVFKQGAAAAD